MKKVYSVDFKLVHHLITFPAYVNDKGPFDFWLDTGGPGLIVKKSLAEKLGLETIDTGRMGIGAGGEVPILIATVDSLRFAEIDFKEVQATVLGLEGMDEEFQHKFHGCIGYHVLKNFEVCVDYVNHKLTLNELR
jgi:predicted aspartyl protease